MEPQLPDPAQVNAAIDIWMGLAYDGSAPPGLIARSQLATLRGWQGEFYKCPAFAHITEPILRYSLRLGNRFYPHMKLALELAPDGTRFLYKADTHDKHICPPHGALDHDAFVALMHKNQSLAEAIENAWAEHGLPTFKTFLKDDLEKRRMKAQE
jgi:hypothetical protein